MVIHTVFDDNFLEMAQSFINSERFYSSVPVCAHVPESAIKSIKYCKKNGIEFLTGRYPGHNAKQISRLLKMDCVNQDQGEGPMVYMDIDIIFQNDISQLEDLNPNYLWVLSKREGHQTTLRTCKRHYFTKSTVEFAREHLPRLTDLPVEEILESAVRNCGVIYGNHSLVNQLMQQSKKYYIKMLKINSKKKIFSDSDQLCFALSFYNLQDKIRELPVKFNRMPYHQSYDYKDRSSFLVPNNVVLHLNKCKKLGNSLVKSWAKGIKPKIEVDSNTRLGVVVPIQTSSVAERSLTKNLYSLAVSNKGNVYRDEDVGFPIQNKIKELDQIRNTMQGERPAYDKGLFFMVNGSLFMIDHGEHTGNRGAWIIGKYTTSDQLAGIFMEQMDKNLNVDKSKIPIVPLSYGTKDPSLWLNQGKYHDISLHKDKKYSIHFIGKLEKNRSEHANQLQSISNSKIEHRGNSKRMNFHEYIQDLARAKIAWCPYGNRPKTHREIEALCCEVAVMMPAQNIREQEELVPNVHYIELRQDHSDVVEKAEYYLSHDDERKEIAYQGRLWYERNVSDQARAKYIYKQCLRMIAHGQA